MLNNLVQLVIVLTGCSAIFMVSRKESWSKYGYIVGLLGQPAWFYIGISNRNWGIVLLTIVYTFSWSQGIYFNFIKK